ncbi:MAG: DUF4864 domain-containing protein [Acidiferrobacterales bacterium]
MKRTITQFLLINALVFGAQPIAAEPTDSATPRIPTDLASLHPDPRFSAAQVIRIQLEALGKKDMPYEDAGIEIAFRFASPSNKSITGPLERFTALVGNPVYRPMLDHEKVEYGEIIVSQYSAVQAVIVTTRDGRRVGYLFSLSKQKTGRYASCWMTDSVTRFDIRGGMTELPI